MEKIFQCQFCSKILSCKRRLEIHEYNMCKYSTKCSKCSKQLSSRKFLKIHESICLGILKCNKCQKILTRKQPYLKHIFKCKYKCK